MDRHAGSASAPTSAGLATGLAAFAIQLALKTANRPGLYRPAFVIPVAGLIALVGAYWALQRVGVVPE